MNCRSFFPYVYRYFQVQVVGPRCQADSLRGGRKEVVNVDDEAGPDEHPVERHDCHPLSYRRIGVAKPHPEQVILYIVCTLRHWQDQRPTRHIGLRGEQQEDGGSHEKQLGAQACHHPVQIVRARRDLAEPIFRRAPGKWEFLDHQFKAEGQEYEVRA